MLGFLVINITFIMCMRRIRIERVVCLQLGCDLKENFSITIRLQTWVYTTIRIPTPSKRWWHRLFQFHNLY